MTLRWRDSVGEPDLQSVRDLVASTSFFSAEEQDIAVELVAEALADGERSGYQFLFADSPDDPGTLSGYACFGPIPARTGAFDLYWIAVAPGQQRHGLGGKLLREAERRAARQGAAEMFIDTAGREQYRPTRAFYERHGYAVHEVIADFYSPGDDKVVYRRFLAPAEPAPRPGPASAASAERR